MSASTQIKSLFKKSLNKKGGLKAFARALVKQDDALAMEWFLNKTGEPQRKAKALRLKNKGAELIAIRAATKNAKRK